MKTTLKQLVLSGSTPATQITTSCLLSAKAKSSDEFLVIVSNFTPVPWHGYRIGVPQPGKYDEIFNSDSASYWGSNVGNNEGQASEQTPMHGHSQSLLLVLPPLATIMLKLRI